MALNPSNLKDKLAERKEAHAAAKVEARKEIVENIVETLKAVHPNESEARLRRLANTITLLFNVSPK